MNYTDAQKAEAVELSVDVGATEAARQTGISKRSINTWRNQAGHTARANIKKTEAASAVLAAAAREKRLDIHELLLDNVIAGLKASDPSDAKAFQLLSVGCATHLDKYRLEMGEATGRTETVDLPSAESTIDVEVARLVEQLDRP